MRTAALPVAFCLSLSVAASAQAPFPGGVNVNGAWVPCDHPLAAAVGRSCTSTPLIDCSKVTPYHEPEHFLMCHPLPATWPVFRVGQRYLGDDYPMIVLSITRALDGVEVVTFQRVDASDVGACRNDGGCSGWHP